MMEGREGGNPGMDTWRETTGRALALLAPFSQVRLTLQLPPDAFDARLYWNFPLRDDERLLAVIDCGRGKPAGFCALTTRRVYWPAGEERSEGGRGGEGSPETGSGTVPRADEPGRFETVSLMASASMDRTDGGADANRPTNGHAPHCRWIDYGALPVDLGKARASDRIDLGGGRSLALRGADPRLIPALERYLAIMGVGARMFRVATGPGGDVAVPGRPAIGARPVAANGRRMAPTDLLEFRRALDAATRMPIVTPLMIVTCVAVFAVMVIAGVPAFRPNSAQLLDWGANDGARVMLRHEYWRVVTSVFIHAGLIHLVVNLWSLMVIGPLIERIYGPLAFAAIYLSAGIGGAIASAVIPPVRVSVGASGAICGVLGALMAFLLVNRRAIPPSVHKLLRDNLVGIVAFMAVLGVVVPNIDHSAHLGGLGTGFASGLLLSRRWPVVPSRWASARRLAMIAAIAAGLAGTAIAATRYGQAFVPPGRRLEDLLDQIRAPYEEFFALKKAAAVVVSLTNSDRDPVAPEATSRAIGELAAREGANLDRFRRATTTDPELRAMADSLIRAQAGQIRRTEALGQFFDTGDRANLAGIREADAATNGAMRDFERQHLAYRIRHGLPSIPRARTP
jgi:rhomboid protease GluP